MTTKQPTLFQMENELYDRDIWAWSIYNALKHAPGKPEKEILWGMLSTDQKDALRILAKHRRPANHTSGDGE